MKIAKAKILGLVLLVSGLTLSCGPQYGGSPVSSVAGRTTGSGSSANVPSNYLTAMQGTYTGQISYQDFPGDPFVQQNYTLKISAGTGSMLSGTFQSGSFSTSFLVEPWYNQPSVCNSQGCVFTGIINDFRFSPEPFAIRLWLNFSNNGFVQVEPSQSSIYFVDCSAASGNNPYSCSGLAQNIQPVGGLSKIN